MKVMMMKNLQLRRLKLRRRKQVRRKRRKREIRRRRKKIKKVQETLILLLTQLSTRVLSRKVARRRRKRKITSRYSSICSLSIPSGRNHHEAFSHCAYYSCYEYTFFFVQK